MPLRNFIEELDVSACAGRAFISYNHVPAIVIRVAIPSESHLSPGILKHRCSSARAVCRCSSASSQGVPDAARPLLQFGNPPRGDWVLVSDSADFLRFKITDFRGVRVRAPHTIVRQHCRLLFDTEPREDVSVASNGNSSGEYLTQMTRAVSPWHRRSVFWKK